MPAAKPSCCTSQQNPSWSRPAADTLKSISWGSHSSWHRTVCTGLPLTPRGQPPSALKLLLAASPQDSPRGAPHPNTAGFLLVTGALRICITFQSGFVFSLCLTPWEQTCCCSRTGITVEAKLSCRSESPDRGHSLPGSRLMQAGGCRGCSEAQLQAGTGHPMQLVPRPQARLPTSHLQDISCRQNTVFPIRPQTKSLQEGHFVLERGSLELGSCCQTAQLQAPDAVQGPSQAAQCQGDLCRAQAPTMKPEPKTHHPELKGAPL